VIFLIILGALSLVSFILVVAASMLSSRLSQMERQFEYYDWSEMPRPMTNGSEIHGPTEPRVAEYGPVESGSADSFA
jgi:hypothetical protein